MAENKENNGDNKHIQEHSDKPDKFEIPRIEKKLGDVMISEKRYEEAIHHYKNSIMALKILFDDESSLVEDEKKATELIEDVGIPVHLNMAFCYLHLEDWKNVVFYCNKVLELKPNHLKALYRRCKAYLKLKDLVNADKDIFLLEKLLPSDSEEIKSLKRNYKEIEKENQSTYQNIAKQIVGERERRKSNPSNKDKSAREKCTELVMKIPQTGKNLFLFGVNLTFKLPLKIAIKTTSTMKYIFWDTPLNLTGKAANYFVVSPAKGILNKLGVYNNFNNSNKQ